MQGVSGAKVCKCNASVSIPVQSQSKYASVSMEDFHGRCPNEKYFPFINSLLKAEGGTNSVNRKCNPLRRSCVSSARNAGESAIVRSPDNPLRRSCVSSARNAGESAICPVPG